MSVPPYFYSDIPVIFQVASLLAAFTYPSHIVIYTLGDSFPCRREAYRYHSGFVRKEWSDVFYVLHR
ncbi:hypothetical protein C5469_10970 [Photorhabdus cinerea]|uniref:Uncharacterized protein n=1 Tax=Photorhabdus cinerea TaxID=471575 RepID=A0A7X5TI76_9GAMM|nr:hypothetical protein [Photorhabdus cinerea]